MNFQQKTDVSLLRASAPLVLALGVAFLAVQARIAKPLHAAPLPKRITPVYADGRPSAPLRMEAEDQGIVLKRGTSVEQFDGRGARDVWVWQSGDTYFMHYDASGPTGWLSALATSRDGLNWEKKGTVLEMGAPGSDDSRAATYGVTMQEGKRWHLFYLGTPNVSGAPDFIPNFPYLTLKATSASPYGPWTKQPAVVPFRPQPNTYYTITASPGHIVKQGNEYLQFFSASVDQGGKTLRTLGIARTKDLNGTWTVDPKPILPLEEQIENSSLYFEPSNKTWFLFTNHIGISPGGGEYTDAVWVYWSRDLNNWRVQDKAVVLDGQNCFWSKNCIGLPSVVRIGKQLAIYYDAPGGESTSHMNRDVGLALLSLPLKPPSP